MNRDNVHASGTVFGASLRRSPGYRLAVGRGLRRGDGSRTGDGHY